MISLSNKDFSIMKQLLSYFAEANKQDRSLRSVNARRRTYLLLRKMNKKNRE